MQYLSGSLSVRLERVIWAGPIFDHLNLLRYRNNMKNSITSLAASLAVGCLPGQADVIIDDFTDAGDPSGTTLLQITGTTPTTQTTVSSSYSGLSGVLGGQRDMTLTRFASALTGSRTVSTRVSDTGDPFLDFQSTQNGNGQIELTYKGLGDLDFSSGSFFSVNFTSYDFPRGESLVTMIGITSSSGSSSLTKNFTLGDADLNGVGSLSFPFANFLGGADFSDVDEISVTLNPARGGDFTLTSITSDASAIPEPGNGILLSGLIGLGLLSRRRKS